MTDQELVRASLEKADNYAGLVERYEEKMFRYVKRFLFVTNEDAEDIVQDTFIQAYKYLNSYKQSLSFSSWIYRIAHNQCVTYLRKHAKNNSLEQGIPVQDEEARDSDEQFISEENVENQVEQLIQQEEVLKQIETLDVASREVLVLRYIEEKEYAEIADIMRISEGTVASLIHRARAKLRKGVKNEYVK